MKISFHNLICLSSLTLLLSRLQCLLLVWCFLPVRPHSGLASHLCWRSLTCMRWVHHGLAVFLIEGKVQSNAWISPTNICVLTPDLPHRPQCSQCHLLSQINRGPIQWKVRRGRLCLHKQNNLSDVCRPVCVGVFFTTLQLQKTFKDVFNNAMKLIVSCLSVQQKLTFPC